MKAKLKKLPDVIYLGEGERDEGITWCGDDVWELEEDRVEYERSSAVDERIAGVKDKARSDACTIASQQVTIGTAVRFIRALRDHHVERAVGMATAYHRERIRVIDLALPNVDAEFGRYKCPLCGKNQSNHPGEICDDCQTKADRASDLVADR